MKSGVSDMSDEDATMLSWNLGFNNFTVIVAAIVTATRNALPVELRRELTPTEFFAKRSNRVRVRDMIRLRAIRWTLRHRGGTLNAWPKMPTMNSIICWTASSARSM